MHFLMLVCHVLLVLIDGQLILTLYVTKIELGFLRLAVGCYIGRVDTSCYQILLQLLSDHIIYVCTFLLELVVQENLLQINNFFLKLQFFMYQKCIILLMLLCIHVNTLDAQKFLAFVGGWMDTKKNVYFMVSHLQGVSSFVKQIHKSMTVVLI
eukprot:TRINITY_DN5556_c0_g1_i5.p6 TRINITY_DN5556_c0_g1~~TRINITY_DN5556_c0_g1_i5.p6  ORF type:complete len:154 (-),score=1.87 TRINITY_DN5556_c0_g1_i5:664-1125(-)